jgi:hypothetical protein
MSSGRIALPIVTALVLVAGGVRAEALYPIQGKAIDLGTIDGTVYYTIQPDGYRVVATLGTESPVRFIATLSTEQSIILSTPRGLGEPAIRVRIMRHGEQLLVDGGMRSPGATDPPKPVDD